MSDTKPLTERLEIKAMMIQMGERIAYGSDSGIMHEAVAALKKLIAERDQLQSKLGEAIQSSAHWQHQFTEAQAANERLNSGWHQANQEALQAKLTVKEQAKDIVLLCDDLKYISGIARRAGMPVDDDNLKVRAAILGAVQNLEAERDALLDRLEKSEKDAERYRWLRSPDTDVSLVIDKRTGWVPPDEHVEGVGGYHTYEYRAGEELDAALDSAMEASK